MSRSAGKQMETSGADVKPGEAIGSAVDLSTASRY
jgi:hypothetical protein